MATLTQIFVLTRLGLAALAHRKWSSLVLITSVACVIGVLLSMLSITAGMLRAYQAGEDPRLAIVLSSQANSDLGNGIPPNAVGTILDAPGIARGPSGHPLADAEMVFWVAPSGAYINGSPSLRAIGAAGLSLRPNLRVIEGRAFRSGRQEVIVGVAAARAYQLHVGDLITLPGGTWPIVGAFSDGGSILESQLVADADTLMTAGQYAGYGSVLVRLENADAFTAFARWIDTNPALKESAERQSDYSLRTANQASAFFTNLSYAVGAIMAIGALFGTVKIMYSAVSARTREVATLRAIGYRPLPVAVSVLLETMVLSALGALVGIAAAWLLFNDTHVVQARVVFDLAISARLIGLGIVWSLALALLGGLAPALRAAHSDVADALRAL